MKLRELRADVASATRKFFDSLNAKGNEDLRLSFYIWIVFMVCGFAASFVLPAIHAVWNGISVIGTCLYGGVFYLLRVADEKGKAITKRQMVFFCLSVGVPFLVVAFVAVWLAIERHRNGGHNAPWDMVITILIAVTVPLVFLLGDYWVADRTTGDFRKKFRQYIRWVDLPTFMAMAFVSFIALLFRWSTPGLTSCGNLSAGLEQLASADTGSASELQGLCQECLQEFTLDRADAFLCGALAFQFIAFNVAFTVVGVERVGLEDEGDNPKSEETEGGSAGDDGAAES